ncbi:MAG: TonB-dependent receptor [Pseudomonadota bacterium]|nr:TonB-dependent receptor [Pseudomonadota bacterium]
MAYHKKLTRMSGVLLGCGAVLCGPLAVGVEVAAPGELGEIIVTAEKRETNLQHTSVAVGVVSGAEIEAQGITQLNDVLKNIVGVVMTRTGLTSEPTIRGVGPTIETTTGGSAGVSALFDDVYTQNNYSSRLGYYDVARVEVLRGPQGTLYGRNSEGGVVGFVSNDPTQRLEGSASIDVGNYSLVNVAGMMNIPLSSTLALRVAGSSVDRKGYISNGQDDNRAKGLRAKLLYQPSENLSLLVGAQAARFSGEGPGTVTAFTSTPSASTAYTSTSPTGQIDEEDNYKVWAKLIADVGIGQLTVLPAYQYQSEPKQLLNNGQVPLISPGTGSTIERSIEVRLASEPHSNFSWVAGLYRYHNHETSPGQYQSTVNSSGNIIVNPAANTPSNAFGFDDSKGVFGQITVPLTSQWRLIAGVRHSVDSKESLLESPGEAAGILAREVPLSASWSKNDWKAGTEFDLTPNSMVYATVATGYRAGGFTPAYPHPAYLPENLRSYELGSKSQFLDNALRINVALYDYDYKNYQLLTGTPCGFLAGPGGPACNNGNFAGFNSYVFNVAKVVVRGAELESNYLVTPDDSVTANLALQRTRIDSQAVLFGTSVQGDQLPNSPKVTFNGSYRHTFHVGNGELASEIGPRYASSSYVQIPQSVTSTQDSWWQWDASVRFAPDMAGWSVTAYVKNATQTVVKTSYTPIFPTAVMTLQPPRTYGISLSARF